MWGIYLRTLFVGKCQGSDSWGNRYYTNRYDQRPWQQQPRWVLFRGLQEATKVPPIWRAWLQHTVNLPPADKESAYFWEKPHRPHLTGTPFSGLPTTRPSKALYQSWIPPQKGRHP